MKEMSNIPVYIKAIEILDLCDKFTDLIFEEYKETSDIEIKMMLDAANHIRENATIIPAKIAGAEAVDLYDLKMENAAIIRKCAREIATNTYGLAMFKYQEIDYLNLIRNEIDEFRVFFAEWVKTFDPWNYIIDRWGLFNPPGINYDDHDPDDDLPFNKDDFLSST